MKFKIVKYSDIQKHKNVLSAEFWITHDPNKCQICKAEKKKRQEKKKC